MKTFQVRFSDCTLIIKSDNGHTLLNFLENLAGLGVKMDSCLVALQKTIDMMKISDDIEIKWETIKLPVKL